MADAPRDGDEEGRRGKPPVFVVMADEGNVPGRPSPKALFFILVVLLIGLVAIYAANRAGPPPPSDRPATTQRQQ
jgi:hypothetical protein